MSEWKIYSNSGVEKAIIRELELHDEWMAESYLTVTVKSAEPVSFAIGDYIDYRGERYCINYDPSVLKKARRGTYGEGFVYDNIKFVSEPQSKIVGCDFTDIVLGDNQMHYTCLSTFPFYCETVDDLLDRVQACLEELYPGRFILIGLNTARNAQRGLAVGRQAQFIAAYKQYVDPTGAENTASYGKTSVALTVDNITCWEALTKINSDFGLNFIQRGDVIVAGVNGVFTPSTFKYGKGNGLYEIERISEQDQQVITRLKAYGSEENLPTRYYANIDKMPFITGTKHVLSNNASSFVSYYILTDIDYETISGAIIREDTNVTLSYGGVTHLCNFNSLDGKLVASLHDDADSLAFYNSYTEGERIDITVGIDVDKWLSAYIYSQSGEGMPNNMAISRLMLPGFPQKSLYDWVKENGGTDCNDATGQATIGGFTGLFSKDKHRPWIQSMKSEDYGVRPGSIYFDGSDDTDNIHPTLEGMTVGGVAVDVIVSAEQIADNGVFSEGKIPNFIITLPNLGFDLTEYYEDGASIDMKDGMCGSRSFKMAKKPVKKDNTWECEVERDHDDSLDLWFPYNDFQIKSGDHYVLTGITMPDEYVEAAAERLFYAAIDALQKNDSTRFTYQPRIDELWMARQHDNAIKTGKTSLYNTIHAGDVFLFEDEDLGIDEGIIIDVLTIKEGGAVPTYEVTLRNEKQVSSIQRMIDKAVSGNSVSGGGSGGSGYTSRQIQSLIENYGSDNFISKTDDDEAQGLVGFVKGLWVKAKGLFGFDADGNIKANDINAAGDAAVDGNMSVGGDTEIGGDAEIGGSLKAEVMEAVRAVLNEVKSDNYNGSGLGDEGFIITKSHNGHSYLEVDELMVRMKAAFAELEIRKETYTGGNQHWSPAGSVLYRVDYLDAYGDLLGYTEAVVPWLLKGMPFLVNSNTAAGVLAYSSRRMIRDTVKDWSAVKTFRCYIVADDGSTRTRNGWKIGDQARCQTFNISTRPLRENEISEGTGVGNIFYWRMVTGTGNVQLEDGRYYDYIDLSNSNGGFAAGSDIPAAGDEVVCWGSRTDTGRMGLISMETYSSTDDNTGNTPAIKMYHGISGFNMRGRRTALISPSAIEFRASRFKWITDNGTPIPTAQEMGVWQEGVTYYYYDRVNWKGCIWLCVFKDASGDDFYWEDDDGNKYAESQGILDDSADGYTGSIGHLVGNPNVRLTLCRYGTKEEPRDGIETIWLKQVNKGLTITSTVVTYAASSNGTNPPADQAQNWYESIAALETAIGKTLGSQGAEYLWTRRVTSYSDNMQPTIEYMPTRYGSVVTGTQIHYAITKDVLTMPANEGSVTWVDDFNNIASQAKGDVFIWTRTTYTYKDGTTTKSFQVARVGNSVVSVEEYYAVGTSNTQAPSTPTKKNDNTYDIPDDWSETRPSYTPNDNKIYLWNFELTSYADGTQSISDPHCIGNMSRGIVSVVETYTVSVHDSLTAMLNATAERTAYPWQDEVHAAAPTDLKPYQWNKTVTTYNTKDANGSFTETFYHISSSKGTPGKSYNGFREFYKLTNSGTTQPEFDLSKFASQGWSEGVIPTYSGGENKYLWNVEVSEAITPAFGATAASSSIQSWIGCIGDYSKSIQSITEEYGLSTSGEAKSDGTPKVMPSSWVKVENNLQVDETYRYMWNRTTVEYTDNSASTITYHVCLIKSVDVKKVTELFIRYSRGSGLPAAYYTNVGADKAPSEYTAVGWQSTPPAYNDDGKLYLWNMEITELDDGTYSTTPPHCIGNFANGIKSVTDYYMLSTDGINHPAADSSSWSEEMPTVTRDHFLWNKEVVKFTDGNKADDVKYHVIALYAADGKDAPMAVLSDTIVSVPCNADGVVIGGAFTEQIEADLILNGIENIVPDTISFTEGQNKGYVSKSGVKLNISISNGVTLTEETVKVEISGYDSKNSSNRYSGVAYFHIRKWVGGDGYELRYTNPMASTATAPTTSTWNSFTWLENPTSQITEALPCIYVAMWHTNSDGSRKTTAPYYVGLHSRYGEHGKEGSGYKTVVYRDNFTLAQWNTYGTIDHSETWGNTSSTRNGCKTGDWFLVVGRATNDDSYHSLTYRCTNDSGNLAGVCIEHQVTNDGADGQGYEYIFKLFDTQGDKDVPSSAGTVNNKTAADDDFVPSGWSDDPTDPTPSLPYEYMSQRKKVNGVWTAFSKPALFATCKMPTVTIGTNGNWFVDGVDTGVQAEGHDGKGVEIKGTVANEAARLALTGLSVGDCYIQEDNRHLYFWTGTSWRDLGEFKGEPGQSSYMHIAWADEVKFKTDGVTYDTVKTNGTAGHIVTVYDGKEHDWIGFCTDNDEADPGDNEWKSYKWNYQKGKDGDGYEYVYLRTTTETAPVIDTSDPTDTEGRAFAADEYLPRATNGAAIGAPKTGGYYQFTDDPQGVDSTYKYEYMSQRKKVNGVWGKFSPATLHRTYAEQGDSIRTVSIYQWSKTTPTKPTSTAIPPTEWMLTDSGTHDADALLWMCWGTAKNGVLQDGWSGPVRMSGKDGKPGEDGELFEYIYKQTDTLNGYGTHPKDISTPDASSTGQSKADADFVPLGWTDNAQGISTLLKYEYCSIREKKDGTWGDFSDPFPWSVYGDKGQDGDGVQYIYKLYPILLTDAQCDSFKPTKISQNSDGEWLPVNKASADTFTNKSWTDDAESPDVNYPYCYCSVIKRVNGNWGNYEKLSLWAKWSNDGKRGDFKSRVYKRSSSTLTARPTGGTYEYPWPGCNGTTIITDGQDGWYDGIPSGNGIVWTSVRTFKGDGTETEWSVPVIDVDNEYLDVEYSDLEDEPSKPTGNPGADRSSQHWYDPSRHASYISSHTMIWRAERKVSNGAWETGGDWVVTRITGEKGDAGDSPMLFSVSGDSLVVPVDEDNVVIDAGGATGVFYVTFGTNKKNGTITSRTVSIKPSFSAVTFDSSDMGKITVTIPGSVPIEQSNIVIKVKGTLDGVTKEDNVVISIIPLMGSDGLDGVGAYLSPSAIVFQQEMTNTENPQILNVTTTSNQFNTTQVVVYDGGRNVTSQSTLVSATPKSVSGYRTCTVNMSIASKTVWITSIGRNSAGKYFSQGAVDIVVSYNGTTFNLTLTFAVNLFGEFTREIHNGVEEAIGTMESYLKDSNGNIIRSSYLYEEVNSAKESTKRLSSQTDTYNMFPSDCSGWRNYNDDTLENFNVEIQGVYSYGDSYSPDVYLKAGVSYVFSFYYTFKPDVFLYYSGNNINASCGDLPSTDYTSSVQQVSGDTYRSNNRYKLSVTIQREGYYRVCINSNNISYFYRPKFEIGTEPTEWYASSQSQIKQTADAISLQVQNNKNEISQLKIDAAGIRSEVSGKVSQSVFEQTTNSISLKVQDTIDGLENTGIDIEQGTVAVEANNFTVSKRGTQVFGVDATTGLTTMNDVVIKGTLMYKRIFAKEVSTDSQLIQVIHCWDSEKGLLAYDDIVLYGEYRSDRHVDIYLPPASTCVGATFEVHNHTTDYTNMEQKPTDILIHVEDDIDDGPTYVTYGTDTTYCTNRFVKPMIYEDALRASVTLTMSQHTILKLVAVECPKWGSQQTTATYVWMLLEATRKPGVSVNGLRTDTDPTLTFVNGVLTDYR